MIFDECTPYPADEDTARVSMELSLRWAQRSKNAHGDNTAALFGIVQGGMHQNLRERSLDGDPDQPVICGCLANSLNPTPLTLPANKTQIVLPTRTQPRSFGSGYKECSQSCTWHLTCWC